MSKITLAVISVTSALALWASDISEVPLSRLTREVPAFSAGGRIRLQGGETLVNVSLTDGTPTKGDLVVLFSPVTKRFFWQNFTMSPRRPFDLVSLGVLTYDKHQALVSLDGSIAWWLAQDGAVYIRTSVEVARDLDDAFDKALSELKAGWETRYSKADYPDQKIVRFPKEADMRDFAIDPAAPNAVGWPTIENMTRVPQGFRVTFRGMWYGEVTIGDDLQAKDELHRVPEPKR
jgi:hypothetical protein